MTGTVTRSKRLARHGKPHFERGRDIMTWFSRNDLRRLALLCNERATECKAVLRDENAPEYEKAFAQHNLDYYEMLEGKLNGVAISTAKRVEVVF